MLAHMGSGSSTLLPEAVGAGPLRTDCILGPRRAERARAESPTNDEAFLVGLRRWNVEFRQEFDRLCEDGERTCSFVEEELKAVADVVLLQCQE